MSLAIAFDVYGTLIDTHGIVAALRERMGDSAAAFSRMWRDKQLEYSFRRGLMHAYASFDVCTRQALDFVNEAMDAGLGEDAKQRLMALYLELPAFTDVPVALAALRARDCRLYALSNGRARSVELLLVNAGLRDAFTDIVSVEPLSTFKPDRRVYQYFAERTGVDLHHAWLVSSNPFDIIGGHAAGMKVAWLRRDPKQPFDPWGVEPTAVLTKLDELEATLYGEPS